MQELLAILSFELSDDEKTYKSIWTIDGQLVRDLDSLPEDASVCLISEEPLPQDETFLRKLKQEEDED